jgi:SAM-dependent methyltransferase
MALSEIVKAARAAGFRMISGDGIEIGALHEPANLPFASRITYVDAISRAQAAALFPEVDSRTFVNPNVITNLDTEGLSYFADSSLDFVVICHVLEHLANPLGGITEIFRVLRPGGKAAIAIPDKRFTYDQPRELTPFEHLWDDFLNQRRESPDDHYLDFLSATTAFIRKLPASEQAEHIGRAKARREHSHVWDSNTFLDTLLLTLPLTGYKADLLYSSSGDVNGFEYFSVWRKRG